MADLIVLVVVGVLVGAAVYHIRKAKKKGVRCIGCPDGGSCGGACSCHSQTEKN